MPRNHFFKFKEFTVWQDRCAMKVCTDACLFGAWVDIRDAERILDIGTGTGLLSLMAAQRSPLAYVEAVEIDGDACLQARANFDSSPFSDRLKAFHESVQAFFPEYQYDTVISNPPFFQNDLKSPERTTNLAHHAEALGFEDLCRAAERLLAPGGRFHVLLPVAEAGRFEEFVCQRNWMLDRELLLTHRPGMAPFRRMMTFYRQNDTGKQAVIPGKEEMFIFRETGDFYDPVFREHLKAFYLGF